MKHCSIIECSKVFYAKGYCLHHYGKSRYNYVPRQPQIKVRGQWKSEQPEYHVWASMKARCKYPRMKGYKNYGGRGIKVCERWQDSFLNFYADMGARPSSKHSLDRINVNGNYEPSNCKWATVYEQAVNKTNGAKSGYIGVYKQDNKWRANMNISLGLFDTPEDAARAYDEAITKVRGQSAITNKTKRLL